MQLTENVFWTFIYTRQPCCYYTKFSSLQIIFWNGATNKTVVEKGNLSCKLVFIHGKVSTMEVCHYLVATYGENVMLVQMIRKWNQQFKAGIDNAPYAEHPVVVHTDNSRNWVKKLILSNRLLPVTELEFVACLARCQIRQFIHKLGFQKICARWMPKMLTEDHLIASDQFFTTTEYFSFVIKCDRIERALWSGFFSHTVGVQELQTVYFEMHGLCKAFCCKWPSLYWDIVLLNHGSVSSHRACSMVNLFQSYCWITRVCT